MSRRRVKRPEKERKKLKNTYVKKKRRKNDKPPEIPVDSKTIDKKLSLHDSAKESKKRVSATLEEFDKFCKKDRHYLKDGRIGDSYQRGQEAFKDSKFLLVEVNRVQEEQEEQLEDVTKWFGENVADMEIMEGEFIEAEDESKDTADLLETSDRIKKEYMYVAGESKRRMHSLFKDVKVAAKKEVKKAIRHAAEHRAQVRKHKKDKRRLLLMSALHHHRAAKVGAAENILGEEVDETPLKLSSKPNTPESSTKSNSGQPEETTSASTRRLGEDGDGDVSIDADGNYVSPNTGGNADSAKPDEESEDGTIEEEDDEDDFSETLDQLKRLQAEVADLTKKRQEDMASVRIAQTNREKTLADFAKYKADSAEKELLMNRKITRLEEQLIRESSRAREKELEERAKFEQEQFIATSANRKGAKVAEIKEKKLRDEIHSLQDKISKLEHTIDDQNLELIELRQEVAKPKIEPEEYERVKALQQEADDALFVMKNELAQQQFEAQQRLEKFQEEAAAEREKLEKSLVNAKKDIEDAKRVAAKNLERAKKAEDEIERLQAVILELEQKIVEVQEEMVRKVAEERERGERLLAEQVELTKAAEAEVARLEKELEEIAERHAKEVALLQETIDKQEEDIEKLNAKIDDQLVPTIENLIEIALETSKNSGSDNLKGVVLEHFRADKLKHYIEMGFIDPNEKEILDSAKLDGSETVFDILNIATDMTTAHVSDVEAYADSIVTCDKLRKQIKVIEQIENTTAVEDGLIACPQSSQVLRIDLDAATTKLLESAKSIALEAEIDESEIDNMQSAMTFSDDIHEWKKQRADGRTEKRDADRKDKVFRTNRLIDTLRNDREDAYVEVDDLLQQVYSSSVLLGQALNYLETEWDDERNNADQLIESIFNDRSVKFIHSLLGDAVDLSISKIDKQKFDAFLESHLKQKQNLRQLKLASVDDTFAASANVEQLNEQLNSAVAKIQSLRSDFTKGLGDAHLEHIQLVNESNSIENNMYLNVGEKDEADAMLLKNKLGGRARFVEANHTERIKTSEERKKERNAAIFRKTGKLLKQIELLESAVVQRDTAAKSLLSELRVTYETLSSYANICEKLKVHAGTHGKVYNRNALVKVVHDLEKKSSILFNILGPAIDLSIIKDNSFPEMLVLRSDMRQLMWQVEFETDDVEQVKMKQKLNGLIADIKSIKLKTLTLSSLREIGKEDDESTLKLFSKKINQHLQLEMTLAVLNLEDAMLEEVDDARIQDKKDLMEQMVTLEVEILKKKQEIHQTRFDFEDEESKKPTPLQLEHRALQAKFKNLQTAKQGLEKAIENFNVQVETLTKQLAEVMQELELLKANNIDEVLADLRAERYQAATLLQELEGAIRYLSRSAIDKKPKNLSAKILKVVKSVYAQTYPQDQDLPDILEQFTKRAIRSKDVIVILEKGTQCLQGLLKLEFGGGGGGEAANSGPSKNLRGSLRVARIGGGGRSQPGALGKIEPKNMGVVYQMRHKLAEKNREMALLKEELESQYQQTHGYGELEHTEKRMRADKHFKQKIVANTLHTMKNGLILGRVTRKLEKIGNEDPENKEMKALMHHQSKLEIMNGRLEAESSNIEQQRQRNLLFALSALERVQLAAENIIGEMPSNQVLEEIFKVREEIKVRLDMRHVKDKLPLISGHGYPQLKMDEPKQKPRKKNKTTPKKSPFGSSAPRKSQFDNSMSKAKIIDGEAYDEGNASLFIGSVETSGFKKFIHKSKSSVQLRNGISPVAQRVTSPNNPPWFPAKNNMLM